QLNQNYPNPFNPSTTIGFSLPARSTATLEIYNVLGQSVERLHSGVLPAGDHKFSWDASKFPSGVYFYRLKSALGVQTKKMLLVK
ncbi:MAG: T9SS type A sorting domain-containing protein, partial [candidate division Zixibacteria bacterium]|nr:T9SS type A sorting domain-containing protein [candidate division Zixibacteria bacterium]